MKNFWKTFGSSIAFVVVLAVFVLFLSSCGGSDYDRPTRTTEAPQGYGDVVTQEIRTASNRVVTCAFVINTGITCDW